MSVLGRIAARLTGALGGADSVDVVARLSLLLIVLSDWIAGDEWYYKVPLRTVAVFGLLVPGWHRSGAVWVLVAVGLGIKSLDNWWVQDNHQFLFAYWSLALALAVPKGERAGPLLAANGRLLVGFAFAFAVSWKILSPDFLDGGYFHYTFLSDGRFRPLGELLGGISDATHRENLAQLARLADTAKPAEAVQLTTTTALRGWTVAVTWWTVVIESAVAVAFLWPRGRGPSRYRHAPLLVFAWTTYIAAGNVYESFGWVLMTLGAAQCEADQRLVRTLFVLSCPLMLVYKYVPILSWVESVLG